MSLDLNPEQLNTCVGCGLCLPFCPTFRVTGDEGLSPRGRIDAMRGVQDRGTPIDDDFVELMATCVQCRACEPACPSGVQYGVLIDTTRVRLAEQARITPRRLRWALSALGHHRLLTIGSTALAAAQRVHLVPRRFVPDTLPLRRGAPIRSTVAAEDASGTSADRGAGSPDVWLFTGCVMDAWFRPVHRATAKVLDALGVTYAVPNRGGACCGALHEHAGLRPEAIGYAVKVIASMPGDAPILVNSAGCGAHLKEYGHLLGTDGAARFSARVFDVQEWIEPRADQLDLRRADTTVIVQDPCHLRNVQRVAEPVHQLLARVATVVELDDDGMCCGAGGAYSVVEPELSGEIRDRKMAAFDRALDRHPEARTVASANPGCEMQLRGPLAGRGVKTVHPIELIAEALA